MSIRVGYDRPVQFGISSHDGVEMLVTNGRIFEFAVEVQPIMLEDTGEKLKLKDMPFWPSHKYYDVSGYSRVREDRPNREDFSVMDGGAFGVNCGIKIQVGERRCFTCNLYRYVMVYFYSENGNKLYRPMCLTCLESVMKRGEVNVQP